MDYIKKTYTDKAIEVQISSFAGKGGVTEYHVLLTITAVSYTHLTLPTILLV